MKKNMKRLLISLCLSLAVILQASGATFALSIYNAVEQNDSLDTANYVPYDFYSFPYPYVYSPIQIKGICDQPGDYFRLNLRARGTYTFQLEDGSNADYLDIYIFNENKSVIAYAMGSARFTSVSKYLVPGTYYIKVHYKKAYTNNQGYNVIVS
ncbi:MAG: pre-peptidase C-terminal domain-containing protein [Clostridia bacterium]|nr:pre-peptidase C-terminal domain-containing protein [Clostridia bacterium]